MDFYKQYITQCINISANNLRLSSEKIEVVAILREHIETSENLDIDIQQMKKITELSKFGIKLGEIYRTLSTERIDFLKLTDQFKKHSGVIVNELNHLLDIVTPSTLREKFNLLKSKQINKTEEKIDVEPNKVEDLPVGDEGSFKVIDKGSETTNVEIDKQVENEELKEKFILEDLRNDENFDFDIFESEILKPIKKLDALLDKISNNDFNEDELEEYISVMQENFRLSEKAEFTILALMHKIFYKSLEMLKSKELLPVITVVEGMRACLIVIVALVRGKEVDITNYLNRAEAYGKQINIT